MSTLKVNELDTKSGTVITVAAGKTLDVTLADDAISAAQIATDAVTADAIAANAVDSSEIAAGAVTNAKTDFQPGTTFKGDGSSADGKITLNCSQNTHGVSIQSPAHASAASYTLTLPTTDGSADEFMQTDGAGVLTWAAAGGSNAPYFYAHLSADDTTPGDNAWTKVKCNTVAFQTGSTYDNSSDYRWTPAVAGKYYLYGEVKCQSDSSYKLGTVRMAFYLNGVEEMAISEHKNENTSHERVPTMSGIIDLGATDYVELWALIDTYSGNRRFIGDSTQVTHFMGYKLID